MDWANDCGKKLSIPMRTKKEESPKPISKIFNMNKKGFKGSGMISHRPYVRQKSLQKH
jgi:hypothetical protein